MKKRVCTLLLALVMVLSLIPTVAFAGTEVSSQWKNFRNSDVNMAITGAYTPKSAESTELKWAQKLGTGWTAAPSVQIIVDDCLVVMSAKVLYKLSLEKGEILQQTEMCEAPNFGYTPPTYAEGMIFCPLANGTVQAFDAKTLDSLWVYQDSLKGQSLSPITYSDGCIYTGFWNGEKKEANYVCLSVKDEDTAQTDEAKTAEWTKTVTGGFYWAGSVVIGDAVIFGTDDGAGGSAGNSHVYALHKKTGAEISALELTAAGDQRSSMAYSEEMGRVYFTTKGGYLCSAAVDGVTGALSDLKMVDYNAQSTSTPIVYGDKVYFATGSGISSSGSKGNFVVADAVSLEMCCYAGLKGYPQCSMLLSTAYYANEGKLYFYGTYNNQPGGLSLIKVDPTKTTTEEALELVEIYDAAGYEQYCICSPICDADGTIYYKNDSGNVLAVGTVNCTEHTGGTATCTKKAVCDKCGKAYGDLAEHTYDNSRDGECNVCGFTREIAVPTDAAKATVYVTISDRGNVVMGREAITVTDLNGDGKLDVDETLYAAHETAYPGGAEAGYQAMNGAYGLSLTKLWGNTSGAFGYWLNDASCWSAEDAVKAGDNLVAFVYADQQYYTDAYTRITPSSAVIKAGESVTVEVQQAGYDANWNTVFTACENVVLTVCDSDLHVVSDGCSVKGTAVTFTKAGRYLIVVSKADNSIVPAVCTVTVEEAPSGISTDKNNGDPTNSGKAPVTGDTGVMVWVVAATVSVLCVFIVVRMKKYRKA